MINRDQIAATSRLIRPRIRRTPILETCAGDFGLAASRLSFKLELFQHAGSFKTRGAFANLLTREIPKAGIVAASGGNHGAAVAYAAMKLDIPAKIFVPTISSPAKIARIRSYRADLVVIGERYADALGASASGVPGDQGISEVGPERANPGVFVGGLALFEEPGGFGEGEIREGSAVVSGLVGPVGLEVEEQAPDLDTLLVAVGGGGLIAGIAAWFGGKVRVVGVEPEAAPTLTRAIEAGRPVDANAGGIAADSLAPRQVGQLVFPIAQQFVERVVLVPDDAIRQSQKILWEVLRVVVEPGGAASFAALLTGRYAPRPGEHVGVLLSGGNTVAVNFDIG